MKRRGGRPPLDPASPSTKVQMRLTAADYDAADRVARQNRESIQTVIRRGLKQLLRAHDGR